MGKMKVAVLPRCIPKQRKRLRYKIVPAGGFRRTSFLTLAPATHIILLEYLLPRGGAVPKCMEYSSKRVERKMAGRSEPVRRGITVFC